MKYLKFLIIFLVLASFASAEVQISLKDVYNAGEQIQFKFISTSAKNEISNLNINLICNGESELLYYKTVSLEKDTTFTLDDILPLPKKEATCYLEFNLNSNSQNTKSFEITKKLNGNINVAKKDINPSESVEISGEILNARSEKIDLVEIYVDDKKIENNKGTFSTSVSTLSNIKSGPHKIAIKASDKYDNTFENEVYYTIIPKPTDLKLEVSKYSVYPSERVQINSFLYDQALDKMNAEIPLKVFDSSNNEIASGENTLDFKLSKYALPGTWRAKSFYPNFEKEITFTVEELKNLSITVFNQQLIVENTGNIQYNQDLLFNLNDQQVNKRINIKPGEITRIDLIDELNNDRGKLTIYYGNDLSTFDDVLVNDTRSVFDKLGNSITGNAVAQSVTDMPREVYAFILFVVFAAICFYIYIRRKTRMKRQQESLHEIRHGRKIATAIKERRSMPAEKRRRTFSASDEEINDFRDNMLKSTKKSLENENKGWGMFK